MKKKESIWQLLKRLDEEAGQLNANLSEANRYFDTAAKKTKSILHQHEKDIHKTVGQIKKVVKSLIKKKKHKQHKKHK